MKLFPLRLLSQYNKTSNLLQVMNKRKRKYVKPDILYGKTPRELVSKTIKSSIHIETIDGKTKVITDTDKIAHAISLRIIYNLRNRNLKLGK